MFTDESDESPEAFDDIKTTEDYTRGVRKNQTWRFG